MWDSGGVGVQGIEVWGIKTSENLIRLGSSTHAI